MPTFLFAIFTFDIICSLNFKSPSIITPKSFSNSTFSISRGPVSPLIMYVGIVSCFPMCKWWHFDLLKNIFHVSAQFSAVVMLSCKTILLSSDLTLLNNFSSSEKSFKHTLMTSGRSLIKNRNKIGPSTLPCGIPLVIVLCSDFEPLMVTLCFLSDKNSLTQLNIFPVIPYLYNFFNSLRWVNFIKSFAKV